MRTSILVSALFAIGALSTPVKRDYVTEIDIVTVTDYVTVGVSPTPAPVAASSTPKAAPAPSSSAPAVEAAPSSSVAAVEAVPASSAPASSAPASSADSGSASPTGPLAMQATGGCTYQQLVLDHHNIHRANHSAPNFVWNDTLASIAAQIASSCYYAHNTQVGGGGYGQNIGAGTPAVNVSQMITNQMYNDEMMMYQNLYGQDSPDSSNFEAWGHFSQIVWKSTASVGCATQDCNAQGLGGLGASIASEVPKYFTVCNFYPPGNWAGEYTNVGGPQGAPMVVVPTN